MGPLKHSVRISFDHLQGTIIGYIIHTLALWGEVPGPRRLLLYDS